MALSEKQRQKKTEKKNKKRKQSKRPFSLPMQFGNKAAGYAKFPVHECLVPSGLFENGMGSVIVARKTPEGDIALSAFVVDTYCLGVKNAMFKVAREFEYEQTIKPNLLEDHEGQEFERVHVACAKKLVEGAVGYAEGFGFPPHADYRDAKGIFDGVDAAACPVPYTYGYEGKPFYVQGPYESPHQSKRIVDKLHKTCGEGGYDYMIFSGEETFQ